MLSVAQLYEIARCAANAQEVMGDLISAGSLEMSADESGAAMLQGALNELCNSLVPYYNTLAPRKVV